jgi:hypothetical protein
MADETYWQRYRAYARRRTSAQMTLVLLPVWVILLAVWTIPPNFYAPGDIRNEWSWRLGIALIFLALYVAGAVFAVRWLLADRRGEKRPRPPESATPRPEPH